MNTKYFSGASPVLRTFAWLSVFCLAVAWGDMCLSYSRVSHPFQGACVVGSLLIAFVAGVSSCCPLGGISAALVVFTELAVLILGSGGASC